MRVQLQQKQREHGFRREYDEAERVCAVRPSQPLRHLT